MRELWRFYTRKAAEIMSKNAENNSKISCEFLQKMYRERVKNSDLNVEKTDKKRMNKT